MKLAFCIFKYFPFGGLQRDFLEIFANCVQRGHQITVFTMEWSGHIPEGMMVKIIPARGFTNDGRCAHFVGQVLPYLKAGGFDAVVGFNKMPGLDLYYAGDLCYQDRARRKYQRMYGPFYWLTPRFRRLVALEEAVFGGRSRTEIVLLTTSQQSAYMERYGTPVERFHHLPPGICKDRKPLADAAPIRASLRREFLRTTEKWLLLMVGVGWRGKGLDRAVRALAALPSEVRRLTRMVAVGEEKTTSFAQLARRLGVEDRLAMLTPQQDITRFFLGADLLVHPAYNENTGGVILESMVYGLPVLTTDVCGFAEHVCAAKAGVVVPSPFRQELMNQALLDILVSQDCHALSANGRAYTQSIDLYSRPELVTSIIEARAERNHRAVSPA